MLIIETFCLVFAGLVKAAMVALGAAMAMFLFSVLLAAFLFAVAKGLYDGFTAA